MAKTLDMPYQSDLWIPVDYNEVAKEIGISVVSVKRYFRNLLHLGYIEQFRPRNTTFRMKPEYLYKGILVKYQTDTVESLIKKGRKKVAK
jgi:predicted transcriptional regulator